MCPGTKEGERRPGAQSPFGSVPVAAREAHVDGRSRRGGGRQRPCPSEWGAAWPRKTWVSFGVVRRRWWRRTEGPGAGDAPGSRLVPFSEVVKRTRSGSGDKTAGPRTLERPPGARHKDMSRGRMGRRVQPGKEVWAACRRLQLEASVAGKHGVT